MNSVLKKIKWNMHESCQKSIERLKKIMNERAPLERREKKEGNNGRSLNEYRVSCGVPLLGSKHTMHAYDLSPDRAPAVRVAHGIV